MIDFADLAVRVDYSEADKAAAALDNLSAASTKAEQSTGRVGVSSVAATRNMGAWSAIQAEAAGHVGAHSLSIGRLERMLASASERMLQMNPIVGILSTSLLKFGIGTTETVGILAGIYAITYAWGKFTEEANKAEKAQDDLVKKLNAAVLGHVRGAGGEGGDMITAGLGRIGDITDNQKYASHWYSRDLNPSTRADTKEKNDSEIALLRLAIKSAETDKQLAEAKQYAGAVSTPYDRAVARGTSLDGFYSKAIASEAQLSVLAKSGIFEVRDAALQAMGTMEKIINHIKLIRLGLAEAPHQILGLESGVAVGGLKQTSGDLLAAIQSGGIHGRNISEFVDQINSLGNLLSTASNQATGSSKTAVQGLLDSTEILMSAVGMAAATTPGAREAIAASVRNRSLFTGTVGIGALADVEAQKKYGETLTQREAALKMPAAFDAVREAALKLGEGLRSAKQKIDMVAQAWRPGNIAGGAEAGAVGGVADALSNFTPQALTYKAVTSGLNFIVSGFAQMATSMLDGGAGAREYARALRQQTAEYAAAIAQFKHDDLAATLASNSATAEQLIKQMGDLYGNVSAVIQLIQKGGQSPQSRIDDIRAQEAKNAEIIKRQAGYAQEDLAVRNMRALGQGDAAGLLAFKEGQQREMQAAIDANRDATYLNTLATTQSNELLSYQNGLLSTALRNNPTGFFGIGSYLSQYATPRSADPFGTGMPAPNSPIDPTGGLTPPGGSRGRPPLPRDLSVTLVLSDGSVLTRQVVKDIDRTAAATGGAGSSRSQALDLYT